MVLINTEFLVVSMVNTAPESQTKHLHYCIFNKNKLVFDPIDPFLMAKNANFYEKHQNVSNPWFLAHLDVGIAYLGKIS